MTGHTDATSPDPSPDAAVGNLFANSGLSYDEAVDLVLESTGVTAGEAEEHVARAWVARTHQKR